jgi:hypothetical protein
MGEAMRTGECETGLRGLRSLALGTASVAIWPSYLLLLAYTARQAPWPRSVAILVSAALVGVSLAVLVNGLLKWLTRPSGWAECYLEIPAPVARQLGRAGRFVVIAAAAMILPVYLLDNGLIMPGGRTLHAPAFGRFLILAFELSVWPSRRPRMARPIGPRLRMGKRRPRGSTPGSSGSAGGGGSPPGWSCRPSPRSSSWTCAVTASPPDGSPSAARRPRR